MSIIIEFHLQFDLCPGGGIRYLIPVGIWILQTEPAARFDDAN